jgi:hypothetical protein
LSENTSLAVTGKKENDSNVCFLKTGDALANLQTSLMHFFGKKKNVKNIMRFGDLKIELLRTWIDNHNFAICIVACVCLQISSFPL